MAGVALPNGTTLSVPSSIDELAGLRERRDLLREQLDRVVDQRADLVRDLRREGDEAVPTEGRAGLQQRITALDARILQIERDQSVTDQLSSNASPKLLAQSAAEQRKQDLIDRQSRKRVDGDEAVAAVFSAFGTGVVLTLLISRWRRGRAAKRAAKAGKAAAALHAADPRLDRLTQTVEAIAEEVERIGEGQRFVTQLMANRPGSAALQAEAQVRERL
jgi:hypothetical protein